MRKALELSVLEASALAHRLDVRELTHRVERLTSVLKEHGIPMPEDDPRLGASDGEHLEACRKVVTKAYELLEALDDLRVMVGSGVELLR